MTRNIKSVKSYLLTEHEMIENQGTDFNILI